MFSKMERHICAVFVFSVIFVFGSVGAQVPEFVGNMLCCPPETYILNQTCYDPVNNLTGPIKFECETVIWRENFTAYPEYLEIAITDNFTDTFGPELACYGNLTKNKSLTNVRSVAILCITEKEEEEIVADTTLGACMIVSVIFLSMTALLYSMFSELRDLFGKSVINFCMSLAIGLGILSIMKLMAYEDMTSCAIRGFLAYFFLMAAFFWTNSISIQVLKDTRRTASVDYGWREFRWYMLYSWGMPIALTTVMAIVNYQPGQHDRPGIGLNHCWFLTKHQQWIYMYSIMTILLLINFGIFIYIATIVWRYSFKSTHIKAVKYKLSMTFRLIVLMGLPWIFEMISSVVGGGSIIMAIVDVINCLQGILVFLVLVVRKRVVKVLHQRGLLDTCAGAVECWLARADDAETYVVQHTDVPMQDDHHNNGRS